VRNQLIIIILLLGGCTKHSSINHLYPEFQARDVVSTQLLYLLEVTMDNQVGHPDFRMIFQKPQYKPSGEIIEIPVGSILNLEHFYEHIRFTEAGTEVQGWVMLGDRKIYFFKTLNHSYNGVKKEFNLPWKLRK